MANNKMYAELKSFQKKVSSNKQRYNLLKTDLVKVHSTLGQGGDIVQLSAKLVAKYPELKRINQGSGTGDEAGFCILLLVLIILIGIDVYLRA